MVTRIRPVEVQDRHTWEAFMNAYAAFYKTAVSPTDMGSVWDWIFDENEDFWCDFAVTDNNKPIGFVQYSLMHRSLSGAKVIYLSDLFVDPATRGGGTGRALIEHVIAVAKGRGIESVRWLTQDFNYAARQLYDSFTPKSDFILYNIAVK